MSVGIHAGNIEVKGKKFPSTAIISRCLKLAAFQNPKDPDQVIVYQIYGKFQDQIILLMVKDPTYSAQNPEMGKAPFGLMFPTRKGNPRDIERIFKRKLLDIWEQLTGDKRARKISIPIKK